jgi:hypothetical protein
MNMHLPIRLQGTRREAVTSICPERGSSICDLYSPWKRIRIEAALHFWADGTLEETW